MAPTTRSKTKAAATTRRLSSPSDPPTYRVDLSLPPEERYLEICADYKQHLVEIVPIYDALLQATGAPRLLNFLAKSLLRRVHSSEENKEIRGISKVTGVPLHLVVAFNTFLDLFSGCSSGGVRVTDAGNGRDNGIVHFRSLDWGMDPLRKLIICVDYVRDGQTVARAVTYAGYIGVLTGVRAGLSLSLNYRLRLASASPSSLMSHRLHQALLLLAFRPSIPSRLRSLLLSSSPPPSLAAIARDFPRTPSTPCYLTFCTPASVLVLEKDLISAVVQRSNDFLAVTNHDLGMEALDPDGWRDFVAQEVRPGIERDVLLDDSLERKECVSRMWVGANQGSKGKGKKRGLKVADVARQLEVQPVQNECTHFSCVMDPAVEGGGLIWVRSYEEAVEMECEEDEFNVSD
ncbi:beta subunit of N-acylethanolamine-hydrolyzing acid amidase-domain-containing protein [Mycena albidolilacea]|uniref:ceramidase n=1 Tax=Mycena albidolilacea TaxID=1033008 RepID=A0AAD7EYB2_9AGAR|nr:beta subunit of N-acylethanolamine-hydrolyzing acid amidase-domain-containing protein [Mycena albidolilacea]